MGVALTVMTQEAVEGATNYQTFLRKNSKKEGR